MDAATAEGLARVLGAYRSQRVRRLVVDLSEVSFIDTVALEMLVDYRQLFAEYGGLLTLRDPSPAVQIIIELAGFQGVLPLDNGDRIGSADSCSTR